MARNPKFSEDEILDRAMAAFWLQGWNQTSIRDLEQALDLKAPSIYRRFGTREGLGVAAIDHYVDRVVQRRVARHLDGSGDPMANIARFMRLSVTQSGSGGRLQGCLLTTVALEVDGPDPNLSAAINRGLAVIENGIEAEIGRAADTARLAQGVTPEAAVATLTLAMQGLMALARGGASPRDLQRRAQHCVDALTR